MHTVASGAWFLLAMTWMMRADRLGTAQVLPPHNDLEQHFQDIYDPSCALAAGVYKLLGSMYDAAQETLTPADLPTSPDEGDQACWLGVREFGLAAVPLSQLRVRRSRTNVTVRIEAHILPRKCGPVLPVM